MPPRPYATVGPGVAPACLITDTHSRAPCCFEYGLSHLHDLVAIFKRRKVASIYAYCLPIDNELVELPALFSRVSFHLPDAPLASGCRGLLRRQLVRRSS